MATFLFSNSPSVSFGSDASSVWTASANVTGAVGVGSLNGSTGALSISGSELASISNNNSTIIVSVRSLSLHEIQNPTASRNFNMGTRNLGFQFNGVGTNPTFDGAFEIDAIGAFTGDLVHIHHHAGAVGPGDMLHIECEASNVTALRLNGGASVICELSNTVAGMPFKVLHSNATVMCESLNVEMLGGRVSSYFAVSNHTHGNLALTNITGTSASNGLSLSAGAGGAGVAGIAGSGASTVTNGTLVFSNLNNVSFGLNGSTMTASIPESPQFIILTGNSAGTNTMEGSGYSIAGGSNVTVSGYSSNAFSIHGRNFIAALQGDGGASVSSGTVVFSNSNNMTFGFNGQTMTAQRAGPAGVAGSAASTLTNGTLVFSNANGVSFGLNGSTMTASVLTASGAWPTISAWPTEPHPGFVLSAPIYTGLSGATGGSTQFTASAQMYSFALPANLEFRNLEMCFAPIATVAGTGSNTLGLNIGFYTLNANTQLDLYTSFHWGMVMSQNSITERTHQWWWGANSAANSSGLTGNVSASMSGTRRILFQDANTILSAGNYLVAFFLTQRSSSVNVYGAASIAMWTGSITTVNSLLMGTNVGSSFGWVGIWSTTTNTNVIVGGLFMPSTIHTSVFTMTGATSRLYKPAFICHKSIT